MPGGGSCSTDGLPDIDGYQLCRGCFVGLLSGQGQWDVGRAEGEWEIVGQELVGGQMSFEVVKQVFKGESGSISFEYRGPGTAIFMLFNDSGGSCYYPLNKDRTERLVEGLMVGFFQANLAHRAMIQITTRLPYIEIEGWDVYYPEQKKRAVFLVSDVRLVIETLQNYLVWQRDE
jgi:hypothetical protein